MLTIVGPGYDACEVEYSVEDRASEVGGEVNALPYREFENSSRVVHIATILGKTVEYGPQKGEPDFWLKAARWNVEQEYLGNVRDVHWLQQLASFTSLIGRSILEPASYIAYMLQK